MVKRTFEEKSNLTEEDVHLKLKALSPFLQQEYLENVLKNIHVSPPVRVLASRKLADLYAQIGMFASAARVLANAASTSTTFALASNLRMSAGIMALKAGDYLYADDNFRNATAELSESEKMKLVQETIKLYWMEAEDLEKKGKMAKAVVLYERIASKNVDPAMRRKVNERLLPLYEKLGKVKEAMTLKRVLNASA